MKEGKEARKKERNVGLDEEEKRKRKKQKE